MSWDDQLNAEECTRTDEAIRAADGDARVQEIGENDEFVEFDLSDVTLIESKVFG